MTKRVLAFLMVIAMVFSLIPTVVVADGDTEVAAGYELILQKAHNQTNDLTVDVYLQANKADQGDVIAFQFDITLEEGLTFDSAVDPAGTSLAGSIPEGSTVDARVLYEPANDSAIVVGDTDKTLVTTIGVELGETELADWTTAIQLSNVEVSAKAEGAETALAYNNGDADVTPSTDPNYGGVVTVADPIPFTACDAHKATSGWAAFAEPEDAVLTAGSYYLTDDVTLTAELDVAADAAVTICLNGYDITAADAKRVFNLNKSGATLNICDCTAHSAEDGTYVAGALKASAGTLSYGTVLRTNADVTVTVNSYGVIFDGTNACKRPGAAVTVHAGGTLNMYGGLVKNFTCNEASSGYGPFVLRGKTDNNATIYMKDVTFDGCGNSILAAGSSGGGTTYHEGSVLTLEDVTVRNSVVTANVSNSSTQYPPYAVYVNNNNYFESVTLKGNCQFDAPVYVGDDETLILALGETADVSIQTADLQLEAGFNERVKMAADHTTVGTLLYKNAGFFVAYDAETGKFTFEEGETIADKHAKGITFKAWDDAHSLPEKGNWYLLNDVTVDTRTDVGHELNLDLNGHTVTAPNGAYSVYKTTFKLFDGKAQFDDEGNWVSAGTSTAKITGSTADIGAIVLQTGAIFNLCSGAISGNTSKNGAGVYMYATNKNDNSRVQPGAVMNMYGGEISNNTSNSHASAISIMDHGDRRVLEDGTILDRAKLNIFGGKIHSNTNENDALTAEGTIRAEGDADITMSGGEISGNTADRGGAFLVNDDTTLTVTGGKITGNTANKYGGGIYATSESEVSVTKAELSSNTASEGGGVYLNDKAHVTITNATVKENSAPNGGAFRVLGSTSVLTMTNTTVSGNSTTSGSGGVAYINQTATVNVTGGEWTGNTSVSSGGAVFADGTAAVSFTNVTFTGNSCTGSGKYGGAIYGTGTAALTANGCTFTGNSSGSAGAAIHLAGSATLRLEDTVVTGNNAAGNGAVYSTNADNIITLAGRTVIAGNTKNNGESINADLFFQNKTRTQMILVDGLEAGAHIDVKNDNKTELTADVVVQLAEGAAAPTGWSCGYITFYNNTHTTGLNVSYVNNAFTFGHYHTKADGTTYPLTEWSDTTKLPSSSTAGADLHYYLSGDVTITAQLLLSEGGTLELCTNGHDISTTNSTRAFRNEGGTLIITDCTAGYDKDGHLVTGSQVKGFHRTDGNGAVFFAPGSSSATDKSVILSTTTFKGIEFTNCYDNTMASVGFGSGVIQVRKQNSLIVDGCKFTDCYVSKGTGGAININREGSSYGWGEKTIRNTVFEGNYAGKQGGAIWLQGNWKGEVLTVDNCVFKENYVNAFPQTDNATTTDVDESTLATSATGYGGAIYLKNANIDIDDCVFEGNYTSANGLTLTSIDACAGGAIFADTGSTVDIADSTFEGNTSAKDGGAIVNRRYMTISGSTFKENTAESNGGAIFAYASANCTVDIHGNSVFEGNTAAQGGAIRTTCGTSGSSEYTLTLKINDTTFKDNSVTSAGGAMRLENSTKATLTNVTFDGNTAAGSEGGGAIITKNSGTTITANHCTFQNNKATASNGGAIRIQYAGASGRNFYGCTFENNTASGVGGAIDCQGNNVYTLNIGDYTDAVTGTVYESTFTGNTGKSGGAIYASTSSSSATGYTANITNVDFSGNTAENGGGIYLTTAAGYTANITDSHFTENKVTGSAGAALSLNSTGNTILTDCEIMNNQSGGWGAVYVNRDTSKLTLKGLVKICDNTDSSAYASDVFLRDLDDNAEDGVRNDPTVDATELDPESRIGINLIDARYNSAPELGTVALDTTNAAGNDINDCFFSNDENRFITYVDDAGTLKATNYVDKATGNTYQTLQAAYDAVVTNGSATKFVVQAGDSINKGLALTKSTTIDLNGKSISKITTGENTLKLIDSETNDFDIADGAYGKVTVDGNVEGYWKDGSNHYVVITEDGVSSAHRVYVSIVSRLLRPKTYGAGFKAIYAGDQMIADVADFGINLTGQTGDGRQWAVVPFSGMEPGLPEEGNPNEKLVAVTNLAPDHWEDTVYGQAYVTVGGVTVDSTERSLKMKTMAASALNALEPTDLVYLQIQEMLNKYPELSVN